MAEALTVLRNHLERSRMLMRPKWCLHIERCVHALETLTAHIDCLDKQTRTLSDQHIRVEDGYWAWSELNRNL